MIKLYRNLVNWLIDRFNFEGRRSKEIAEFCHYHKDLLIIIADPKTDKLFMSYRDKHVANQIKSAEGYKTKVVRGVLSHSLFKSQIDNLITAIMDSLQLSLKNGNQFYLWIDGALFNIARALRIQRINKKSNQASKYVRVGGINPTNTPNA